MTVENKANRFQKGRILGFKRGDGALSLLMVERIAGNLEIVFGDKLTLEKRLNQLFPGFLGADGKCHEQFINGKDVLLTIVEGLMVHEIEQYTPESLNKKVS